MRRRRREKQVSLPGTPMLLLLLTVLLAAHWPGLYTSCCLSATGQQCVFCI